MVSVPASFPFSFPLPVELRRPSYFGSTGLPQIFIGSETPCLPNGKPMSNRNDRLKRRLEGLSTPPVKTRRDGPVPAKSATEGVANDQEPAQSASEKPDEPAAPVAAKPKAWWKFGR
jgi:hypothetical protein